jgi:hypothetical protein
MQTLTTDSENERHINDRINDKTSKEHDFTCMVLNFGQPDYWLRGQTPALFFAHKHLSRTNMSTWGNSGSSMFCPRCHAIMELPDANNTLHCNFCQFERDASGS